ncbi:methyltransferase domain-containing protein [Qipengyuania sp. 6D47A]|uniref:Methyltransferase domain-containing protein n=2 Tax=Qipengyuania qiaonensis TaxID=2867240 RepID=A0ABS7JBS7_9SPHN|nr:methyltransferase domain-containing protein [Qipengyuania qiaonensis]
MRFLGWRNCVLASRGFQRFAARNPVLRPIARRRAAALFDLVAGFTYSQTLFAVVESGLLERLEAGPALLGQIETVTKLDAAAAQRLLRAAAALDLVEEVEGRWWVLGRHGAALCGNDGAIAMIRHHRLLYADLVDPLALLADECRDSTRLARFWKYGAGEGADEVAAEYSQLMAISQQAVADEALAVFPFSDCGSLLDVGGGNGTFLRRIGKAHPQLRVALFDLPDVVALAQTAFAREDTSKLPTFHAGNFFDDSIPRGYDLISLVRILHDHDDVPALRLLENIHRSMTSGARLMIVEPMAKARGAEAMGDAYFGLYLWAMGSGRPRSASEIQAMLGAAGFRSSQAVQTHQPIVTSIIIATA